MSYRSSRLPQAFKEEISAILMRELRDVATQALTTITDVSVSADLSQARVFVSVFGSPTQQQAMLERLNERAGFVRSLLARRMRLRTMPQIRFVFDESIEQGDRMLQIFEDLKKELPPDEPVEAVVATNDTNDITATVNDMPKEGLPIDQTTEGDVAASLAASDAPPSSAKG